MLFYQNRCRGEFNWFKLTGLSTYVSGSNLVSTGTCEISRYSIKVHLRTWFFKKSESNSVSWRTSDFKVFFKHWIGNLDKSAVDSSVLWLKCRLRRIWDKFKWVRNGGLWTWRLLGVLRNLRITQYKIF